MHQHYRDLAHPGTYLLCLALLIVGGTYGSVYAFTSSGQDFLESVLPLNADDDQRTRIGEVVATAREVREALARPLPPLEKLPPITATVAYGHLRPEGNGQLAIAAQKRKERRSIRKEAMEANAMVLDFSSTSNHLQRRPAKAVVPELHKVY
jgi:hypothetical protein